MSRNGAGVYSLPAGSTVTNGDVSDATDINTPLADIAADLNVARPIVAGGTGAVTAAAALANLGLTATAAEINIMDGVTASTAELNILDGVTSTAAELNILDGATMTVTELNYVDGVTSAIQTQLDAKQPLDADLTALAGLATAGMIARTGAGTVAARTLTPGSGISISNGDGVSGNPTITANVGAIGWEPYNTPSDGKYYDFAVHGAVASVETPTFADDYEYMIILDGLTKSGPSAAFNIEIYRETTAAYSSAFALLASVALASGKIEFPLARKTLPLHIINPDVSAVTSTTPIATAGDSRVTFAHSGSQKISKARLSFSGANTSAGKLYLYRRSLQ